MKGNKLVIGAGVLLMIAVFFGIFFYGRLMNPPAYYVLAAASNIEANTNLASLGAANFMEVDISSNQSMASTFVTKDTFLMMQQAGGQFVRSVAQNEPIKYTDIASPANPMASNAVTLGITDPNKVVVTINVEGYAPNSIRQGDFVDIIAVSSYDAAEAYSVELANLMNEARNKANEQIKNAEEITTTFDFESLGNSYSSSDSFSFDSFDSFGNFSFGDQTTTQEDQNMFTVTQPALTEELQKKADLLEEKATNLENMLKSWNEFLEAYSTIDPVALSDLASRQFYYGPMSKVLVNGAQVMHVGRVDDSYTSDVNTIDVLINRDDIEWVYMANEGGALRIAVLPQNANPNNTETTLGASMKDLVDAYIEDREKQGLTYNDHAALPTSK